MTPEARERARLDTRDAMRRLRDRRIDAWRRAHGLSGLEEWKAEQRRRIRDTNKRLGEMQ
jgi:hypothetical protein